MNELNNRVNIWRNWYGDRVLDVMGLNEMKILINEGWSIGDIELELMERLG